VQRTRELLERYPVVAVLGARQVGKTTLARQIVAEVGTPSFFFDLEDPEHLARLGDPLLALKELEGLVVLDEVQRLPGIFQVLRVLADRPELPARFLILGSASPELLRQSSESLAGRIFYHDLPPLTLEEVGWARASELWLRGGFPLSYLGANDAVSAEWRRGFVRTFLERDLPQLGVRIPSETLRRFWTMLAHYHAQVWNGAELSRAFGVSATTVRRYLDVLTAALVLRQLPPWFENISKRQVRSPKVYIADSGLLHSLLSIETREELESHPKVGASWEGFLLAEVVFRLRARSEECFFWATHAGAEVDLLVLRGRRRHGFEFKRTVAPRTTRSMHTAIEELGLEQLFLLHAGETSFPMTDRIRAVAVKDLDEEIRPLT
jgi:predicted AAA+ superfamily ATPase